MRPFYHRRRDDLEQAIAGVRPDLRLSGVFAGMHALIYVPSHGPSEHQVLSRAAKQSIALHTMGPYRRNVPPPGFARARYNARSRHEVHQRTLPLSAMEKYDRPVGIGTLITVDTTGPVDVAAVAAEVRRLHTSYLAEAHRGT